MDVLRLRFRPDDQWIGELTVSVSVEGFSGMGTAWFSTDDLREFAEATMAFPLSADVPLWNFRPTRRQRKNLPQELVALTFEPHNKVGAVRATVHLATESWKGKERDLAKEVTIRFLVSYGDLGRFGPAMLDAIEGRAAEAVLTSTL